MTKSKSSFEESVTSLEDVVKKLESGDLTLDESLKSFEEGVKLSRLCEQKLDEAKGKIEKLIQANGKQTTAEMDVE